MRYPIKLLDLELQEPLESIAGLERYAEVQALVRLRGVPIGTLRLPIWNGHCSAAQAAAAVRDRLTEPLVRHGVEVLLGSTGLSRDDGLDFFAASGSDDLDDLPLVTVAVCTRDRTEDLARCIVSLEDLDYPFLELLVIDNAPAADTTERLVASHERVRYVNEPRPGLDWARNRAVLEARGEIVAFTDDDAVVDRGWVRAIVTAFAEGREIMAVTGLVLPLELETEAQVLFEEYGGFGRGFDRIRCSGRPLRRAAWAAGGAGKFGTGANMAFRRALFSHIGLFDPALDVGTLTCGGGDLEMFFRTVKEGYTLVYEPRALVRHRHRREYAQLRTQLSGHGLGLASHFVRCATAYPEERWGFVDLGLTWFHRWHLARLARSLWKPTSFPRDLIRVELEGMLRGLFRYPRARREAARIEKLHGPQSSPEGTEVESGSNLPSRQGIAVRTVELSQPVGAVADIGGYLGVRLLLFLKNAPLGVVDLDVDGPTVPASLVRRTISEKLAQSFIHTKLGDQFAWVDFPRVLADHFESSETPAELESLPGDVSVSVVVATRDRPDELRECLGSLVAQRTPRKVEIVVVDNRPESGLTAPVVAEFPDVVLLTELRRGSSYARNTGLVASSGDIAVTVDDDVVTPSDWLERLITPFARQDVMAVTGLVLPRELDTPAQMSFEAYGGLGRGFDRFEAARNWFESFRLKAVPTWRLGATANAAFRTRLFADPRIGLMSELLGAGMPSGVGEDTYLFYRLLKAGHRIVYEPSAFVWHRHRRTEQELRRQLYSYSAGHVAYNLLTVLKDGDWRGLFRVLVELPLAHAWRAWERFRGRSRYPYSLLLLEVFGNLLGPWSLWRSFLRVRRQGRSSAYRPAGERASARHQA